MSVKLTSAAVAIAALSLVVVHVALGDGAQRADTKQKASFWASAQGEWMPLPDIFPRGGQMKVVRGDPASEEADFYFRFPAKYGVPMHFHSPVERVYIDQGTMRFTTFQGETKEISEGGYAHFPERVPHEATCVGDTDCLFYLYSDGPFDIHLVDEKGRVTESWSAAEAKKKKPAS